MRATLRFLGAADVASGVLTIAIASWLGDELGLSTSVVRVAGALLVVLGAETVVLAGRRAMATATVVAEGLCAFLMVEVLLLADTTGTGAAVAIALAIWCAAAAVRVATLQRTGTGAPVAA